MTHRSTLFASLVALIAILPLIVIANESIVESEQAGILNPAHYTNQCSAPESLR